MANITITTVDGNHIKVDFGDYYTDGVVKTKTSWYNRCDIEIVEEYSDY